MVTALESRSLGKEVLERIKGGWHGEHCVCSPCGTVGECEWLEEGVST